MHCVAQEAKAAAARTFVGRDARARDVAAETFAGKGVDPEGVAEIEKAMAARKDRVRASYATDLELQIREKELKKKMAEQERILEQARLKQV